MCSENLFLDVERGGRTLYSLGDHWLRLSILSSHALGGPRLVSVSGRPTGCVTETAIRNERPAIQINL